MDRKKKIGIDAIAQILAQNMQQLQNVQQLSNPEGKAKPSNKKKFSCFCCKRKFVYLTGLTRHVQKFHPEETMSVPDQPKEDTALAPTHIKTFDIVIKCKNCGEIFPNVYLFEAHITRYNWELMFMKSPNAESNGGTTLFMEQVLIAVIHSSLVCEFCDAYFSDYASLFYHEAHHSPTSGYGCTFCKENFYSVQAALEHRAQCSECINFRAKYLLNVSVMYSCNVCMSLFPTLPELHEHRYNHHHYFPRRIRVLAIQDKQFSSLCVHCEICGFVCNNIYVLLKHRNAKHALVSPGDDSGEAEKPHAAQRSTVKRVEKEESNHCRQFLCEKCGKTYTQSSHLWQHLRFHNGVRPFACTVQGCTRRFTIRPDLSDHIRKCHTGERPYECEVCHKRFLTGSVFYQHRLIHRNERRHACKDCDRRFYRADALKNHRRIHTGEKPYVCAHCDRKFRQRGDREKHVRVKHLKYR